MTEHTDHEQSRPDGGDAGRDWRAAWKAARTSGQPSDGSAPADEPGPPRHGTRAETPGWAVASANESAPARTATSTLDPEPQGAPSVNGDSHHAVPSPSAPGADGDDRDDGDDTGPVSRSDPAASDVHPDSDSDSDTATGGLRATFVLALARARAMVDGRVDPASTGAGAPAAGSLSAPVAAEIAATTIPPVTLTSAALAVPAPTPSVVSGVGSSPPAALPAAAAIPATAAPVAAAAAVATVPPPARPATPPVPMTQRTAAPGPAPAARRGARRVRRAHLKVTRIDPWTVMKVSFMLSIAFGIMTVVATAVVWSMLDAAGVFTSLNETIGTVTGGADSGSSFDLMKWVAFHRVLGATTLVAVVDVVLITALATLGAFLYNLASALIGGVEVTLVEDQR